MPEYEPPFTITNRMLTLVSSISEKIGELSVSAQMDAHPHLRRNNKIRSVHSSLAIEANSLTLGQVQDVIDGKTVFGKRREIQEVKNTYDAYDHLEDIDPFSIDDLKKYHGIMTKYLVECIFMAPPARLVPSLMLDLFAWMDQKRDEIHPLIMSSVFHYEFVFIHPFSDGNGRMARLWHTALLMQWKSIFEFIPIESQIEKFQDDYYAAISHCHKAGSSDFFIEFMLEKIDEVLGEIASQT